MAKANTIIIPHPVSDFNPSFDIAENFMPDIGSIKNGQRTQLIVSYEVIEKTKSYTVLRANIISLKPSRRQF